MTTEFPSPEESMVAAAVLLLRPPAIADQAGHFSDSFSINHSEEKQGPTGSKSVFGSQIRLDLLSILDIAANFYEISSDSSGTEVCSNQLVTALSAGARDTKSNSTKVIDLVQFHGSSVSPKVFISLCHRIPRRTRSRTNLKKRVFQKMKQICYPEVRKAEDQSYGDDDEEVTEGSVLSCASTNRRQPGSVAEHLHADKIRRMAAVEDSASSGMPEPGSAIDKIESRRCRRLNSIAPATSMRKQAEAILEYLSSRCASERSIRNEVGDSPDTSKALRLLLRLGEIKRSGLGGHADPFQYTVAASHDLERQFSFLEGFYR